MAIRGGFLRLVMITAYAIAFCCAAIITGAFAWVSPTKEEKEKEKKKENIPPLNHFPKSTTFRIETPFFHKD